MKKNVIFVVILLLLIPIVYSAIQHPISKDILPDVKTETQVKERPSGDVEHYVYGVNGLVAVDNGSVKYVHKDHLGSNRIVTNELGEIEGESKYLPFGESLQESDSRFTYTGKELDKKSKLQYSGARYYDQDVGRFTQVDPIKDGLNWYVYTNNNPMNYIDPSGLEEKVATLIKAEYDYIGAGGGYAFTPLFGDVSDSLEKAGYTVKAYTVYNAAGLDSAAKGAVNLGVFMHGTAEYGELSDSTAVGVEYLMEQEYSSDEGGWCFLYSCSGANPAVSPNMAMALSKARGGGPVQGLTKPIGGNIEVTKDGVKLVAIEAQLVKKQGLRHFTSSLGPYGQYKYTFKDNEYIFIIQPLKTSLKDEPDTYHPYLLQVGHISSRTGGSVDNIPVKKGHIIDPRDFLIMDDIYHYEILPEKSYVDTVRYTGD